MKTNETKSSKQTEQMAAAFAAMGHPTRVKIIQFLQQRNKEGERAGLIQNAIHVPASTLSHHLALMQKAGLLSSLRQERFIYYRLNETQILKLAAFFHPNKPTSVEERPVPHLD